MIIISFRKFSMKLHDLSIKIQDGLPKSITFMVIISISNARYRFRRFRLGAISRRFRMTQISNALPVESVLSPGNSLGIPPNSFGSSSPLRVRRGEEDARPDEEEEVLHKPRNPRHFHSFEGGRLVSAVAGFLLLLCHGHIN